MTKVVSEKRAAQIISKGLGWADVARWPLVALPDDAAWIQEMSNADHEGRPVRFGPNAPVRGLKLPWGVIIAEWEAAPYLEPGTEVLTLEAYLDEDPYIELAHLREGAETVGSFLSDIVASELRRGASDRQLVVLSELGLEFVDNDRTKQVFSFIGFNNEAERLPDRELGAAVAHWLATFPMGDLLQRVQRPKYLRKIGHESDVEISSAVLQ
jgi:hypothetical protein